MVSRVSVFLISVPPPSPALRPDKTLFQGTTSRYLPTTFQSFYDPKRKSSECPCLNTSYFTSPMSDLVVSGNPLVVSKVSFCITPGPGTEVVTLIIPFTQRSRALTNYDPPRIFGLKIRVIKKGLSMTSLSGLFLNTRRYYWHGHGRK